MSDDSTWPRNPEKLSLDEAIERWDGSIVARHLDLAASERHSIVDRFPLEEWPALPLERYALGVDRYRETYCYAMEYASDHIASIRGGSAAKHLIYYRGEGKGWYFDDRFGNEQDAWQAVRGGFVRAFELAGAGKYEEIGGVDLVSAALVLLTKSIATYFPDGLLPICSHAHQQHFWELLGGEGTLESGVPGSFRLLERARERLRMQDRSPAEIALFLYWWAHPRPGSEVVKIAPGANANMWDDCRANGYIRVGWPEMGDLLAYATKDEFRARFGEIYAHDTASMTSRKANELWTLRELQPGDVVVANRGMSEVVGIGTVLEPGYEWRPELGEYPQAVRVRWDDTTARAINPIGRWRTTTVCPVSQADYRRILEGKATGPVPGPAVKLPPAPRVFSEIEAALRRKGQVILYGPPGTGKTYTASRFAIWWLAKRRGDLEPERVLVDDAALRRADRSLATTGSERRIWWIVANPKEWQWDALFRDGTVDYRYGRLQRNYGQLQPGDLVVGYLANPDKRIVALARIAQGLHATADGSKITLEPMAPVANGPTYDELLRHPTLSASEPMRFRNQGTLFALSPSEAEELLAWLVDRDPSLPASILDTPSQDQFESVGPLTRVTFHPSYGYEDFIEGFKPAPSGSGQLDLRLTDGIFKRVCRAAAAKPDQTFVVLIDEINRGNIAKIFGELITLLEKDKRDIAVMLPQSGETFSVPANVFVIGTMNTADRSIKLLDAALRRRFAFIELMPDPAVLRGGNAGGLDLEAFLAELNRRIAKREGREKQIGHSFFLDERGQPLGDVEQFADQVRHEVVPLLQEYAYDDYGELVEYLGAGLVDTESQALVADVLEDPNLLVQALRDSYRQEQAIPDEEG